MTSKDDSRRDRYDHRAHCIKLQTRPEKRKKTQDWCSRIFEEETRCLSLNDFTKTTDGPEKV
jgi:hypothetical protein